MIDKKVYKTDFQSEFAKFFNGINDENKAKSKAVIAEVKKYSTINRLRDHPSQSNSRNKLWEGF